MKEIGILTWYKATNHGAILQAYGLKNYIESMGYKVSLLDYEREVCSTSIVRTQLNRIKRLLNGDLKNNKIYRNMNATKRMLFDEFIIENFNTKKISDSNEFELIIVGSDMVFSLDQGWNPYMFGIGLHYKYIISYAACAGGSTRKQAKKLGIDLKLGEALSKFSTISVRDHESKKFVEMISQNANIIENIDPVLLYGFEKEYIDWDKGVWETRNPYILIYAYHGRLNNKQEVQEIKDYANRNKLDVVSVGYYHSWCDENISCSPQEFIEIIKHAKTIVTDTFHGTVFSTLFHKEFAVYIRDNAYKIVDYLEKAGLTERIVTKNKFEDTVKRNLQYQSFDTWLAQERQKSHEYLHDVIQQMM